MAVVVVGEEKSCLKWHSRRRPWSSRRRGRLNGVFGALLLMAWYRRRPVTCHVAPRHSAYGFPKICWHCPQGTSLLGCCLLRLLYPCGLSMNSHCSLLRSHSLVGRWARSGVGAKKEGRRVATLREENRERRWQLGMGDRTEHLEMKLDALSGGFIAQILVQVRFHPNETMFLSLFINTLPT